MFEMIQIGEDVIGEDGLLWAKDFKSNTWVSEEAHVLLVENVKVWGEKACDISLPANSAPAA